VNGHAFSPRNLPATYKIEVTYRNPEAIMLANYDAERGMSGSPVYSDENDKIIGMHIGHHGFQSPYNTFITFDDRLRQDIETLIAATP
jgi:hypothetical protein